MDVSDDVKRLADFVRLKIRSTGHFQNAVERRLGWGEGYLSQLLRGNQDLKVKHVYAILRVIGVPPSEFFSQLAALEAYSPSQPGGEAAGPRRSTERDAGEERGGAAARQG
jgi:transcriptional regulator with XRE-family HTH domain